ncbi:vesicle transport protein SFT2A isoform X4 [Manis javanica]|uniref:vesicle transport protein SFT2A isoform X4 n=1 Tax=Manis javanica TaxID=9974 RepID=UPI003C6D5364
MTCVRGSIHPTRNCCSAAVSRLRLMGAATAEILAVVTRRGSTSLRDRVHSAGCAARSPAGPEARMRMRAAGTAAPARPTRETRTSGCSQGLSSGLLVAPLRPGAGHGEAAAGPERPGRRGAGPDLAGFPSYSMRTSPPLL